MGPIWSPSIDQLWGPFGAHPLNSYGAHVWPNQRIPIQLTDTIIVRISGPTSKSLDRSLGPCNMESTCYSSPQVVVVHCVRTSSKSST